ncbi:sigma-70 family RNA polymerase sigma factor [Catellatospora vulcania]|uniref:sigma-70 family RNA polymerase sigma factor n=1 Tax=Catellatospora vulcania TaxID=1460450 RepID=UPI0012D385BD|nr:sigma-70 family RNA polymerase sigma factor [Catellatospora vulcania]
MNRHDAAGAMSITDVALARVEEDHEFADFYRTEFRNLVLFTRFVSGVDLHDAVDIAQEAMIALHGNWEKIESPVAFVRKVASRRASDSRRRSRRQVLVSPTDVVLDQFQEIDPYTTDVDEVRQLIRQLPEQQRMVFALHLRSYPTADMAAILHLKEATVRSTLRHARERLRLLLAIRDQA